MNTLIIVAVLGQSWSWQDSIRHAKPAVPVVNAAAPKADPPPDAPAPPPKAKANLLRSADCNCPDYGCMCEIPCRCAAPPKVTAKPAEPPPTPPVKRQLWELKANDGTIYRMYEREELITLVTEHNRQVAAQAPPTRPASTAFNPQAWLGNSSVQPQQYAAPLAFAPIQQGYGQGMPMMFGAGGGACGPGGCN